MTQDLESYHIFEASRRFFTFIDELSTWYVRRSRDRFKNEGQDKEDAAAVLRRVLSKLVKLMAPFAPFVSESVYQKLGGGKESVHLEDWPEVQQEFINKPVLKEMDEVRKIVESVHSLLAQSKIKIRQQLRELRIKAENIDKNED